MADDTMKDQLVAHRALLDKQEQELTDLKTEIKDLGESLRSKEKELTDEVTKVGDITKEVEGLRAEKQDGKIEEILTDLESKGNTIPAQREDLKKVLVSLNEEGLESMEKSLRAGTVVEFKAQLTNDRTGDGEKEDKPVLTNAQAREIYGINIPDEEEAK